MTDEVKRDVKNTVFVDLFNQDEYRLQLFQTLHPEITDVTADELQIITIYTNPDVIRTFGWKVA